MLYDVNNDVNNVLYGQQLHNQSLSPLVDRPTQLMLILDFYLYVSNTKYMAEQSAMLP